MPYLLNSKPINKYRKKMSVKRKWHPHSTRANSELKRRNKTILDISVICIMLIIQFWHTKSINQKKKWDIKDFGIYEITVLAVPEKFRIERLGRHEDIGDDEDHICQAQRQQQMVE